MNTINPPADRPLAERITREPLAALERRCRRLNDSYAARRISAERGGENFDAGLRARMLAKAAAYSAAYMMVRNGETAISA